jgi:outer membrane biosynthesis protein TonB
MTCRRWSLALLGLALAASESRSQFFLAPAPYGYGGFGLRYGRTRGPMAFSLAVGGYGGMYGRPVGRMTTVLYTQPAMVLRPSAPLEALAPDVPQRLPPEVRPVPGAPAPPAAGPEQLPPPKAPAEKPKPKPEAPPEKPKPEPKKPRQPGELPRPPMPVDDPKAESLRLLESGKAAFAAGEYGRAAERFRRAAAADPGQPQAHFLRAQAQFALGKYPAAVDAVLAGLALAPDWPTSAFRPLELYGANVADYSEHLRRLAEVLRHNPDNPDFLFLYAYELWFDGRRDEARLLFERARRHGADPAAIDRFLMALPPGPVL